MKTNNVSLARQSLEHKARRCSAILHRESTYHTAFSTCLNDVNNNMRSIPSHLDSFAVERSLLPSEMHQTSQQCPMGGQVGLRPGLSDRQLKQNQTLKEKLKGDLDRQINERKLRELQRKEKERVIEQKEDAEIAKYLQEQQKRVSCIKMQNEQDSTRSRPQEKEHKSASFSIGGKSEAGKIEEVPRVPHSVKVKGKSHRVQSKKVAQSKSSGTPSSMVKKSKNPNSMNLSANFSKKTPDPNFRVEAFLFPKEVNEIVDILPLRILSSE